MPVGSGAFEVVEFDSYRIKISDNVRTAVIIDTGAQASIGNLALQRRLNGGRMRGDTQTSLMSVTGQTIIFHYARNIPKPSNPSESAIAIGREIVPQIEAFPLYRP